MIVRRSNGVLLLLILSLLYRPAAAQQMYHHWSKLFGDSNTQVAKAVAVDGSNNVFIVGYFESTVNFGGSDLTSSGDYDIFIAKFDNNGHHLWSKRFGDSARQRGESIACDSAGDIIITGSNHGTVNFGGSDLISAGEADVFLAKLDGSDGSHIWSDQYGDASYEISWSVTTDNLNNVFLTGPFMDTINFGGGDLTSASAGIYDIFVAKFYGVSGAHVWSKRFGDAGQEASYSVVTNASGDIVVAGHFWDTISFGGSTFTSNGDNDIVIAKLSGSDGSHIWSKSFGSSDHQTVLCAAFSLAGDVVITGYYRNTVDFGGGDLTSAGQDDIYLAKLSGTDGTHIWSERFGDSADFQQGYSVAVDGSDNVILTGWNNGNVDFGGGSLSAAGFLAKFSSGGSHLWSQAYSCSPFCLAIDSGSNVALTGKSGTVDFGGGELAGAGVEDAFLVKFGPNQALIPTLSEWGLLILTVIICFYAVVVIRRKKQVSTN